MQVDMFVMDTDRSDAKREKIEHIAADWWINIEKDLGVDINLRHIKPKGKSRGLQYAIDVRQTVFTCPGSDIFILADNDMLPFSAKQVEGGLMMMDEMKDFAILSAWPDPADFAKIALPGRETIENDYLLETYSVGAFRFCRKIHDLKAPQELVKGYDGVFCRHLWREHGYRVGYLKKTRAFHLGNYCTTLWDQP
jgi:hypothetical protein